MCSLKFRITSSDPDQMYPFGKQLNSKYLKNKICWKTNTKWELSKKNSNKQSLSRHNVTCHKLVTLKYWHQFKKIRITNTASGSRLQSKGNNNCQ